MTWYDPVVDAIKSGYPGFAGSSVFAIVSKPKSKWQVVAILASGLSISQIFTSPVVGHFDLQTFVGPIGFIIGFSGMIGAQIGLSVLDGAKEFMPNIVRNWIENKLGATKKGDPNDVV